MPNVESFLLTANGFEVYVLPNPVSMLDDSQRDISNEMDRRYHCARAMDADCAFQAPEIQTMYNVPMPISMLRTRIRQEFERNRYVDKIPVVDVLLFKSHAEYQVRNQPRRSTRCEIIYYEFTGWLT